MKRPADHRLEDRVHARPLAAHRLWRHHRSFVRDVEEHLFPGELRVRKSWWVLARWVVEHLWLERVIDREAIQGMRFRWRHLLGDFRLERQAHFKEALAAAYLRGEADGRDRGRQDVYDILERKLVDQEFPIR